MKFCRFLFIWCCVCLFFSMLMISWACSLFSVFFGSRVGSMVAWEKM